MTAKRYIEFEGEELAFHNFVWDQRNRYERGISLNITFLQETESQMVVR